MAANYYSDNYNLFITISCSHLTMMILLIMTTTTTIMINPTNAATDTFIYVGCSQTKYTPNSQYSDNINALLTSVINSSPSKPFDKYTVSPGKPDAIYGLYQCRPDLTSSGCTSCVSRSIAQLGNLCAYSTGAAIQLDGCYVRYDNTGFFGVEDKAVADRRCGPAAGNGAELQGRVGAVLDYLGSGGDHYYRIGKEGDVMGVAMCVGDLSGSECGDCLEEAVGRLRGECSEGGAVWGDMFLAKCYARYSVIGGGSGDHGSRSINNDHGSGQDEEVEKTLAILIGLIAGVALLIVFLSFLRNSCGEKDGK